MHAMLTDLSPANHHRPTVNEGKIGPKFDFIIITTRGGYCTSVKCESKNKNDFSGDH